MSFGAISSDCSMTFDPAECTTLPSIGVCMRLNSVNHSRRHERLPRSLTDTRRPVSCMPTCEGQLSGLITALLNDWSQAQSKQ